MSRVRVLDPQTINQIAAGEVVERPASVVKELVENSLDAGARRIEIEVRGAGKELIQVSDDGCGMSLEDARLALERHATSKIRLASDLRKVATLGFRGEALPSIASVSRLRLSTAEADGERIVLEVEFGKLVSESRDSGARGTEVRVQDLFANTPARLKFLRSDSAEVAGIVDLVGKYVVAHPEVAFLLRVGNSVSLASPGNGNRLEALAEVWGHDLARALAEVDFTHAGIRVQGFVAPPHVNRPNRQHQWFFVNGRPVRSKTLQAGLDSAFRAFTPEKRYAVAVLCLSIKPSEADVNVSPTKSEIKFAHEGTVFDAVRLSVKNALMEHGMIPKVALGVSAMEEGISPGALSGGPHHAGSSMNPSAFRGVSPSGVLPPPSVPYEEPHLWQDSVFRGEVDTQRFPFAELLDDLRVLGQVLNTFIVASTRKGLVIIDQHVAHERILYEYFCGLKGGGPVESQALLSPATLTLERGTALALREHLEELTSLGFHLEPFGNQDFLVRAIPAVLAGKDFRPILQDLAEEIVRSGGQERSSDVRHKIWTTSACRMAVKAGDALSLAEMEQLILELAETENPYLCPHGRPITLTLPYDDLLKRFKRS